MRREIIQILRETNGELESRFIKSAESIPFIVESIVDTNLITDIEIENIRFDQKYNEISADLVITSWNEDQDLFLLTEQLKKIDKELDKVFLKYSFRENGFFGKNKGKYNNLMFFLYEINWSTDNNFILKMKYALRQEDYDDE